MDLTNTNFLVDLRITTGNFKVDVSDNFPDCLVNKSSQIDSSKKETFGIRPNLSSENLEEF